MRLICAVAACAVILGACTDQSTSPATASIDRLSFGKAPAPPANPVLAYGAALPSGTCALWCSNADGSNATQLVTTGNTYTLPSWAPGGSGTAADPYRIVFEGARCRMHRVDVIVDPTTGRPAASNHVDLDARFDVPAKSCEPAWSPKGDQIAFGDGKVGAAGDPSRLWVVDPEAATAPAPIY